MALQPAMFDPGDEPTEPPEVTREILALAQIRDILAVTNKLGCNPRPHDDAWSDSIAQEMLEGRWDSFNPIPIALCVDGAALQGQHCLNGALKAGMDLACWVARYVPHRTAQTMDGGKKRSPVDVAAGAGITTGRKAVSSAARLVGLYLYYSAHHWTSWGAIKVSNPKLAQWIGEEAEGLALHLDHVPAIRKQTGMTPTAALAFQHLIYREAVNLRPEFEEFRDKVVNGGSIVGGDPAYCLIRDAKMYRNATHRTVRQLGQTILAWNKTIAGRTCAASGSLSFGLADQMPIIYRYKGQGRA